MNRAEEILNRSQGMGQVLPGIGTFLKQRYLERRRRNPAYSLRAFARQLGIPAGRLSEFMSGKRNMTKEVALKVESSLQLDPTQRAIFWSIVEKKAGNDTKSQAAAREWLPLFMEAEQFYLVADWEHFAILSLMETKGFKSDIAWIARRLRTDVTRITDALERLQRCNLIRKVGKKYQAIQTEVATTSDVSSEALRRSHRQTLEQAIDSLESAPLELRDISSMTMAIDVRRIPEAKRLIMNFRRQLMGFLESGERTEVFNLNIQLVPLTDVAERKKLPVSRKLH